MDFQDIFDDGVDTMKIIMDVEDLFGISIPDCDAERIQTPGQLADYVAKRIMLYPEIAANAQPPVCSTAHAFYRVKSILRDRLCNGTFAIRPNTSLDFFLPSKQNRRQRRECWKALSQATGAALPELAPPGWVNVIFFLSLPLILMATASVSHKIFLWMLILSIPAFSCEIVIFLLLLSLCRHRLTKLPSRCATVGQLARLAMLGQLKLRQREWTRESIWCAIREVTANSARVTPRQVRKNSNFIKDFV